MAGTLEPYGAKRAGIARGGPVNEA